MDQILAIPEKKFMSIYVRLHRIRAVTFNSDTSYLMYFIHTYFIPTARNAIIVLSGSFMRNCLGSLSVPPVIIVFSLSCVILVVA